jgi:AcrR family transcriptional regulator
VDGLTAWTLRDLAAKVGMRAPSLYTHFDGKDDIHDAMFAEGWEQLEAVATGLPATHDRRAGLIATTEAFLDFCTASVPRYQLLFTHVLGEWTPSPDAYAVSQRVYGRLLVDLAGMGITDPAHVDLWTALTSGLAAQQLANDLGGDRWHHLVPDAVDMFLAHTTRSAR